MAGFLTRLYRHAQEANQKTVEFDLSTLTGQIAENTIRLMDGHYDYPAEFFTKFLDQDFMAYSMAWYGLTPKQVFANQISLEQAQLQKFEMFCQRAKITGTERILNIGCGFGSLERFLWQRYPEIKIVSLTPSKVQFDFLLNKIKLPSDVFSSGRYKIVEGAFDDRTIRRIGQEPFDLIVSIGVFEHLKNIAETFRLCADLLKPNGRMFHHLIVSQNTIPHFLDSKVSRIENYFPGGRIWPLHELERHTTHFSLENSWFINGMNYWRTLDEWHQRFWQNIPSLFGSMLNLEQIRHWNNYFSLCKAVFSPFEGNEVGNGQYLFYKRPH